MHKILLVGGASEGQVVSISDTIVLNYGRFSVMDNPLEDMTPTLRQTAEIPTPPTIYSETYYDIIPVIWCNEIIDYYGKECSIGLDESFELYKRLKEK